MNKINIDKVIKQSKGLKSSTKFNSESDKLNKLLEKFMHSKDSEFNKIFAEWMIIRLVTVWEYHFKSLIISLIDEDHCRYDEEIKLSLLDLEKIQKKKTISAGKIFVSTKPLQSIESIDKILSNLLRISFVKELKKAYPDYIDVKTVNECLEKRHEIIHEMKRFIFTKQQIRNYATYMMLFQIQSAAFCAERTNQLNKSQPMPTVEIVDDDKEIIRLTSEILEKNDLKVVSVASNGKTAVSEYEKTKPDVVLLDVLMPKFNGLYALEHIKKINKNAKVIMVTADMSSQTKRKALKLGAAAILYKPFDIDKLVKTIKDILINQAPMIIEKRQISKSLHEQMIKENIDAWFKK